MGGDSGTEQSCAKLEQSRLDGNTNNIVYDVNLHRRLRLTDIRITGTNKLTLEDIAPQLKSRKASALAFLPFLGGYGRGYTSNTMLEENRRTVEALMKDLGYRHSEAT